MASTRRSLIAAAGAFALPALAPFAADGRERRGRGGGCRERAAYAGEGLRPQLFPATFDAAEASAKVRARMVIDEALENAFDAAAGKVKAAALTAAVMRSDGGRWFQLRVPRGDLEPKTFVWAGLDDAYTATAILQMVEEGKLTVEDRLDKLAPQTPGAGLIRIDDLLCHTTGLAADPSAAPAFCPGATWAASAGDYAILRRIVETLDGRPWREALKARVVDRLGLEETAVLAPGQVLDGAAAPATGGEAGAVAASALDAVRFWRGLMANQLHGRAITRGRYYRLYPMAGVGPGYYGQGVMVTDRYKVDPSSRDIWLGHAGVLPGASALVAYSAKKDAYCAVALTGEGAPDEVANLLFKSLPDAKPA